MCPGLQDIRNGLSGGSDSCMSAINPSAGLWI